MATTSEALEEAREQACECRAEALLIENVISSGNRVSGMSVNTTTFGIIYTDAKATP